MSQSLLTHLRELRDRYQTNDSAMLLVMVQFLESIGKDDEAAGYAEGECERMDEEHQAELDEEAAGQEAPCPMCGKVGVFGSICEECDEAVSP